jgi:hypothetical protein
MLNKMSETRQIVGVTKPKKNICNLRNICFINIFRVDNRKPKAAALINIILQVNKSSYSLLQKSVIVLLHIL